MAAVAPARTGSQRRLHRGCRTSRPRDDDLLRQEPRDRHAEPIIWSIEYYCPEWQAFSDLFNSLPLILPATLFSSLACRSLSTVFIASILLRCADHLPPHRDDSHRHLFPVSDWRFKSPSSYRDPAHHGRLASLSGLTLAIAASIYRLDRLYIALPWIRVTRPAAAFQAR